LARRPHGLAALLALCAISPAAAGFDFNFVKSTDTDSDTDFTGFLPTWLDSDQTLLIPIGIDPKLIDPKTWTNFTAPDSDIWPFLSLGSDSDSNSDSNIEVDIHESVVRIVFHYLNFAVGKNKATNLMSTMDTEDPNFAIASDVTEQSDETCESAHGEGWTMAQMTNQQFMSSEVQAQLAQALISSLGENVPAMTGVKDQSGDCLMVKANHEHTTWTSADCSTEAAALCAASKPNPDTEDIFVASVSAQVGTASADSAIARSTIITFSPANLLVVCLCATAMYGFVQARRMKRRRQGTAEEKMPLNSVHYVENGATSQTPATLV
jgi:hypothetical protein